MKILLASADPDEIRWAAERRWVDGVFTTPFLLHAMGVTGNGEQAAAALADAGRASGGPVYASVQSVHAEEMYREARELARAAEQTVMILPFVDEAVPVVRRLTTEGIQVGCDYVYTAAQALLAAKAGAVAVIMPFGDHDMYGHTGFEVLAEIRAALDATRLECDLLAASPRTAAELAGCTVAGANAAIVGLHALRACATHPLTDRAIDRYLHELSRITRPRMS